MNRAVLACVTCGLLLATNTGFTQDSSTIRVNVRLVRLLVTVRDAAGALIGSLNKPNFTVYDNGVKQNIAVFEHHTDQPLSVAVLIDTSASTGIDIKYELDSVARFFRALFREGNPHDAAALYSFNWQVRLQSGFTRHIDRLVRGLHGLRSEGGTSMYDAIWLAAGDLEDRDGRHVLVVVTDGGDTTSNRNFHQALQAAQMSDAVIYPVLVVPITNDAGRNIGGENALAMLASGTGGQVFTPQAGPALDRAFDTILQALRTQYLIGFYPQDVPPDKSRYHTLRVDVDRPGLRVITRNGYYGESAGTER